MKDGKFVFTEETEKIEHVKNFSYANGSSIGVGGYAPAAFYPKKISELITLVETCKRQGVSYHVLGNATNVLPPEGNSEAVVIFTTRMVSIGVGETVFALAGATTDDLLNVCESRGRTGAEFLEGIPATLGGAAYMNAGACGKRMDEIVESVLVYKDGKIRVLKKDECGYSYKESVFMHGDYVVLGVSLALGVGEREEVRALRDAQRELRKKLPIGKSMGCVFKNPTGTTAGKLVEGAGLKGFKVGGAYISREHANFIINGGLASGSDVRALINLAKSAVLAQYGVRLEEEIRYLT